MLLHPSRPSVLFVLIVFVASPFIFVGCDSNNDVDSSLVGTWRLTSVNGQPPTPGVFLQYVFTESTVTVTSDLDCIETNSYITNGNTISVTVTRVMGSQCGNDVGDTFSAEYRTSGNTLTLTVMDEDLGTGVFVFTKVS